MNNKENKLEEKNEAIRENTKGTSEKETEVTLPQATTEPIITTEDGIPEVSVESSSQLLIITELLKSVTSLIENKISYDETKEKMFQTLYQQLKEYKEGFLESIQRPIIKTLLPLYDSILRLEKAVQNQELSREYLDNEIYVLKSDMEEVLYRMDVFLFTEHPQKLDRKLHKTIKVIETSDLNEDKHVVEILKYGFFWKGNILRPEEVVIKRYFPQKEEVKNV